jgi:hypothetical protein
MEAAAAATTRPGTSIGAHGPIAGMYAAKPDDTGPSSWGDDRRTSVATALRDASASQYSRYSVSIALIPLSIIRPLVCTNGKRAFDPLEHCIDFDGGHGHVKPGSSHEGSLVVAD